LDVALEHAAVMAVLVDIPQNGVYTYGTANTCGIKFGYKGLSEFQRIVDWMAERRNEGAHRIRHNPKPCPLALVTSKGKDLLTGEDLHL
jgi:hypothetical protein